MKPRFIKHSPFWNIALFWIAAVFAISIVRFLMMEAVKTSETLVNFYQNARHCNPEDGHLRTHDLGNLKLYFSIFVFFFSLMSLFSAVRSFLTYKSCHYNAVTPTKQTLCCSFHYFRHNTDRPCSPDASSRRPLKCPVLDELSFNAEAKKQAVKWESYLFNQGR
jgi:hypothetical protein